MLFVLLYNYKKELKFTKGVDYMKKVISVLLVVIMLLISSAVSGSALDTNYLYKDRFIEEYGYVQGSWGYNELYYHYTDDNTIDWVLVRAHKYIMVEPTDNPIYSHYVMGDIVYSTYYHYAPFETEYGIYDVAKDEFLDITKIDFDQYSGLRKVVYEKIDGRPIGDCDKDRELSILDATAIQRELALIQKIENDYFENSITYAFQRYADFDRDGDVSIMDATAIQRRLAKLDVPVATPDEV